MARVFIDGFEAGQLDLWDLVCNASVATGIGGMDGAYCVNLTSNDKAIYKDVPAADEYYVAFRYKIISPGGSGTIISFTNGATRLGTLTFDSTSRLLQARRGDESGAILGTGTTAFVNNTVALIEVHYKPHDTTGIFQVKVNGVLEIDFSGDTTNNALQINRIIFGRSVTSGWVYGYVDNVIIDNAVWVGDTRIQAIKPTGPGNSTQWDPSAGANWDCVEEVPASDTDDVSTNVADEIDLYTFGDLTGSIEEIKCVQAQARAIKEGAPTPQNLQLACRSGGTNYTGPNNAPGTTAQSFAKLWETNPNTSNPWAVDEVNAAEIGVKAVA